MTFEAATVKARAELVRLASELPLREPFLPGVLGAVRRMDHPVAAGALLEHWMSRAMGPAQGDDRYRWELTHARGTGTPNYAGEPSTWTAWRASEQERLNDDVHAFEARLSLPIVLCETFEFLAEVCNDPVRWQTSDEQTAIARQLITEAEPVLRRDFAAFIQARHPFGDSFALWILTQHPDTFERLHPIAVALAETYAALTHDGALLGARFPFHDKPLVSATSQLAQSLWHLGLRLDVVADAARVVAQSANPSGGFADANDPEDLLTTLVAARLLATTDPRFDLAPTALFFLERQEASGLWKAMGPEAPWLTRAIADWLEASERPFADRFQWPHCHTANLDKKTGLPFFATFADLAVLFDELDGLRQTKSELAFIDLAGFREFNNRFGQDTGDSVLALFASELGTLSKTRAIRDGGDEFLVLGAPEYQGLADDLDRFRNAWPGAFHRRFGSDVPAVAPRILLTTTESKRLLPAREALGKAIAPLKERSKNPTADGVLFVVDG